MKTKSSAEALLFPNLLLQPCLLGLVYLCVGLAETASTHATESVAMAAYAAATVFALLCFVVVRAAALDARGK